MIKLILMTLILSLAQQVVADNKIKFIQVIYQESSPGVGAYPHRILVNDEFIRLDGGNDEEGFILFDRKKKEIVSVSHDDQSRFVIKPQDKTNYTNEKVIVRTVHSSLEKAPEIQGVKAKIHDITANETLCRQVLSFEGLMPKVTVAWKEFEELMQTQNQISLSRTPKQLQTECFLTNNITHASLFLDYGLPFSVRSKDGTLRILKSYSDVEKPASFLTLPASYREFNL